MERRDRAMCVSTSRWASTSRGALASVCVSNCSHIDSKTTVSYRGKIIVCVFFCS
ncbi:hypothetical protein FOCC_FOCC003877, partial [Frankliniella occidentalis]